MDFICYKTTISCQTTQVLKLLTLLQVEFTYTLIYLFVTTKLEILQLVLLMQIFILAPSFFNF